MSKKMRNAPVYFALGQIRFNALLALDKYIAPIQDDLRKAGYPDFGQSVMTTINLNIGVGEGQPVPSQQAQSRYQFLNKSRTTGFVLDPTGIVIQTTDYDVFETFSEEFLKVASIVHAAADLDYSERVGLRFLDAVCPKQGEKISEYLVSSLLGIADELAPRELVHAISDTRTRFEQTTLVSRVTTFKQASEGAAFPAEFGIVPVKLTDRFAKLTGLYAVIDTDCWVDDRTKFDVGGLEKTLNSLHDEVDRSFKLMVTPHALSVWE
jgi:uncharacterized protein (TIGR04255 family)